MARYKVRTGTLDGKVFLREVEASNPEEARDRVEREGLVPIEVLSGRMTLFKGRARVRNSELLVFNQGFMTLLKAGIPLVEVIETLKKSSRNQALSAALDTVIEELRSGSPLSKSLGSSPEVFPLLYVSTIEAGERTGDLIPSIKGYIDFQKRTEAMRKKIVSSASYPLILAGASILVVSFLIAFVVPSFAGVYMNSGAELPLGTRALMAVSDFMKANFLFFPPALVIIFFSLRQYIRTGPGKVLLGRLQLAVPGIGELYRGYEVSKFSRTTGMLLKSGVSLVEALGMSKGVLSNAVLKEKLESVVLRVKQGGSMTDAVAGIDFMPEITLRMLSAGEKSASLQTMCEEIAEFHDREIEHRVEVLTSLLEPALMIIMGIIIGAIVVFMYMPIFQLGARV